MRMRRTRALLAGAVVAAGLGTGAVASGLASGDDEPKGPKAPIPRTCWFSDYANAKLSNKCEYREDERRWYMDVEGEMLPADEQQLPVANLCHYFHGQTCPKR
jgi:hypothetical protein